MVVTDSSGQGYRSTNGNIIAITNIGHLNHARKEKIELTYLSTHVRNLSI